VEVFKKYDDLNASVQENLTSIRTVKAYVREEHETSKFYKASEVLYQYFIRAEKLIIINGPAMQFTIYSCILLLSWLGAKMIVSNSLTTGELMSLFAYTTNILMSLMFLSMIFVMVIMSKSSAERITEVLNEKSDLTNCENPIYEVKDGSITFKDVNFSYSKNIENSVLEDVDIKINSGETIGIIGGTGSAKSTLVQLIPRLYDATKGSVEVGGVDVKNYDIETLRDEVSMVLQKNVLFSGTIKENLRWGNKEATDEEIIAACRQAQAEEFIETLPDKYDTHIEQGGTNVSGGQKQRLCIARALLKKPKILILDDSTSAVDTKTDALIRRAFKETIPDTTKIIIAQRISSVEEADRIIVLNDGKIDGFGTHDELLKTNDIYAEVYESQVKGADNNESK
jgi:ATP-binding cassette subfamily B protein